MGDYVLIGTTQELYLNQGPAICMLVGIIYPKESLSKFLFYLPE